MYTLTVKMRKLTLMINKNDKGNVFISFTSVLQTQKDNSDQISYILLITITVTCRLKLKVCKLLSRRLHVKIFPQPHCLVDFDVHGSLTFL